MNQTFDLQRFTILLKLNFVEKGRNYMLTSGLFIGLLFILLVPTALSDEFLPYGAVLHFMALPLVVLLGGSVFTSSMFSQYTSPSTGIAATLVPGSILEKFLTALVVYLCFSVLLLGMFLALHYFTIDLGNSRLPENGNKYQYIPKPMLWYFACIYIISQGAFFLGSIYFSKFSYLKTAGILFLTFVLTIVLSSWLTSRLVDASVNSVPFVPWQVSAAITKVPPIKLLRARYIVYFPEMVQYMIYALPVLVMLGLWYISFLRLKEKEF
ncbi:hypothetical protein [Dyadobacter psychrotolerans]|uniref:Uncharacterized protein n=1 Tax=Dyadobacter psychrotolerans TaxID=2541721 RepID=A0A4R5DRT4_9BACT|nr:hypothetical protein [Dyadobacter psychrotolerans]TDE16407.1 hypothetical protein E0F88_09200 [Dyadobacter psychrotolerans]